MKESSAEKQINELKELNKALNEINKDLIKLLTNEISEIKATLKELQSSSVKLIKIVPEDENYGDYKVWENKEKENDKYYELPDEPPDEDLMRLQFVKGEDKVESVVSYNRETYPKSQMYERKEELK